MMDHPEKSSVQATVIFDFDSTLIKYESLDTILAEKLKDFPEKAKTIAEITNKGMSGELSFFDSLSQRIQIAAPKRSDLRRFTETYCPKAFSAGIPELIRVLHQNDVDVWILSGGFEDAILPFAQYLGIPDYRVHAVQAEWYEDGCFKKLNKDNDFAISKLAGAQVLKDQWISPTIIVGDGYTDFTLYQEGLADHFIAYTEHVSREKVVNAAKHTADSAQTLSMKLKELLP